MPQQLLPYWNALKRWWWLPVISATLAGASAYLYWRSQPPVYQARIALIVGNSAQSINPNAQQLGIERTLATFYGEMTRRQPITQAVIQHLGLPLTPEQLGDAIETRVVYDAQILEIYVYNLDPQLAATLATEIAKELIAQSPAATSRQQGNEEFIRERLAELQKQVTQVDQQIADLTNRMSSMTSASELSEAKATLKELESLKQDYTATYANLLSSLSTQDINSLSIIEPASVPTRPISIGLTTTLLIAIAGGIGLSIAAIVVLEYADDVLRWGDAPFALSLPVLGVVPIWRSDEHTLILTTHPHSAEADALRSLRARINIGGEEAEVRKIVITSPAPRDGKSFTAVNLAAAAAAAGLRTILVDGDLRLGNLHTYFNCAPEPGLSDLLRHAGHTAKSSESIIQSTPIENLFLIPLGRPALDPASLLSTVKLEAITNTLLLSADLIIIDSPPVGVGADATLLASVADAAVLVASVDRTRRRMAIKAIAALERYNLLGLIFNRVSLKAARGDYHQYYSQPAPQAGRWDRIKARFAEIFSRQKALQRLSDRQAQARAATAAESFLQSDNGHESAEPEGEQTPLQHVADRLWDAIETVDRDDTVILTTSEAAERMGATEETVRGWCVSGRLPAVRIGKQWLVTGLTLKEAWSEDDTPSPSPT